MKTTQHTPGPWYPGEQFIGQPGHGSGYGIFTKKGAVCVATVHDDPACYPHVDLPAAANARLIAAAPDLLAQLRIAETYLSELRFIAKGQTRDLLTGVAAHCRAAISKATA